MAEVTDMALIQRAREFTLLRDDRGQDLIEYAFLAVFIALVVTAGLTLVGTQINSQMSNVSNQIGSGS